MGEPSFGADWGGSVCHPTSDYRVMPQGVKEHGAEKKEARNSQGSIDPQSLALVLLLPHPPDFESDEQGQQQGACYRPNRDNLAKPAVSDQMGIRWGSDCRHKVGKSDPGNQPDHYVRNPPRTITHPFASGSVIESDCFLLSTV
jgi:hypothetical protein